MGVVSDSMKRITVGLALVALLLAGCSSDGSEGASPTTGAGATTTEAAPDPNEADPCVDIYAEGATTSEDMWAAPCSDDAGELHLAAASVTECTDGRSLAYNDEGWGYLGEPWHNHADGAEQVAPQAERDACG